MSTHLTGFPSFSGFLYPLVWAKLGTSNTRVKRGRRQIMASLIAGQFMVLWYTFSHLPSTVGPLVVNLTRKMTVNMKATYRSVYAMV